jgi:sugar O-acyltransferase (sialic acid O-acetyltransferase NeuD family)
MGGLSDSERAELLDVALLDAVQRGSRVEMRTKNEGLGRRAPREWMHRGWRRSPPRAPCAKNRNAFHPDVTLGPGSVVCAGGIVQAGASIGAHVILNTKASVDHHCHVGDYAHIAVAHLGGGASIGEGVFLALGSIVLPGRQVGDWAVVGAGAVVTKNVAPSTTVVGVPARPIASQPRP